MRTFLTFVHEGFGRWKTLRRIEARHAGCTIGRGVEVRSPERLVLGTGVRIDAGVMLHCGGMEWSDPGGGIRIGDHSYVGPNAVLFGAGGITIGREVLVSPSVVITSHQHGFDGTGRPIREQQLVFGRVTIEDDVWIGAGAVVLPGVTLGAGSVIGAGAVVTRDIEPGRVVMGVPARVVRTRAGF